MAISHIDHYDNVRPVRLLNRHLDEIESFLLGDEITNLFLLSWLENHGVEARQQSHFQFLGLFNPQGTLSAVALNIANNLIMLEANSSPEAERLGSFFAHDGLHFQHIVSARKNAVPFWQSYSHHSGHEARLIQDQSLFVLNPEHLQAPTDLKPIDVRQACLSELDPIFLASARMHREETAEDPLLRDPAAFRRHVRFRISHGRTFVVFDRYRRLLFKADISTRSSRGAQLSGVYTSPHCRNQGIATRALSTIARALFTEGLPRLTLYVNEVNLPALKVYQNLGFQFHRPYQTVFIAQ